MTSSKSTRPRWAGYWVQSACLIDTPDPLHHRALHGYEIFSVCLPQYVAEAITALTEAPLKAKDIQAVVQVTLTLHCGTFSTRLAAPTLQKASLVSTTMPQVCSALHQQYADFGAGVGRAFSAALTKASQAGEERCVQPSCCC